MSNSEPAFTLEVRSCGDCPRFRTREVRHWLAGPQTLYEYSCSAVGRVITPADGVNPPPVWCPLRKEPAP